jgi:phosphoglycolate phosphatase-like HAD superfamily hydrolase
MAIVSAQRQVVIDGHCNKNAFNKYFQHVIGNTLGKVEAIKGIVHCFCLLPGNIFYVGDFVSDVEEALAAGVIAVGITRGQETRECLLDAGAHYCIEHLTELLNILQQRSQLE